MKILPVKNIQRTVPFIGAFGQVFRQDLFFGTEIAVIGLPADPGTVTQLGGADLVQRLLSISWSSAWVMLSITSSWAAFFLSMCYKSLLLSQFSLFG